MSRLYAVRHEFVRSVPDRLDDGVLYVSVEFATAIHKCCCGCGMQVVTPFSPTDWRLTFDGTAVSLDPSIGNWSFACKSHYWIIGNRVRWASRWLPNQIESGRKGDQGKKKRFFARKKKEPPTTK